MEYYIGVIKKYAVFEGRARRAEYWYFMLFNTIILIALSIISPLVGDDAGVLSMAYGIAVLLPSVGVAIRRLHDTGRRGWWYLIGFIPIIGTIVLIVFLILDSNPGQNKYGPNPKGVMGDTPPATPATPATPAEPTPPVVETPQEPIAETNQ